MLLTAIAALAMNQPVATPSPRQLEWQKLEYYAFVHFGPNTFTDKEWGEGKEDPNLFNPTALDCRQWVRTFKDAGMKQVIITAKHHDGFCLWPSAFSTHTVAQSKWRDGKGDVLMELRKACNEYGMKMGVYLSPWDRNHPKYGTPEYNQVFANMLKEVLTKYGPIYEVWFDGANGEGPNGKKQVYDWDLFNATVRKYAPNAVIFGDGGPDIRWVGNEEGHAPETCWSMIPSKRYVPGTPFSHELGEGNSEGDQWTPVECDVSIRPGWFYHTDQDSKVKTPDQLMDLYERSVGHNGSLLLNVPPDRRGQIHEQDVEALMGFKKLRDATYKIAVDGPIPAGHGMTVAKDGSSSATIALPKGKVVDRLMISESLADGQKVRKFEVYALSGSKREKVFQGTTIGSKRIVRLNPLTADVLKVVVTESKDGYAIASANAYATPSAQQDFELKKLMADKDKRMAWFREAKFGMFIHWGLYAVPAGVWNGKEVPGAAEWLQFTAKVPVKDYEPLIKQFNPTKYDPKKWVEIAKDAGMKYIVITSKHHEGFGLWPSKQGDWNIGSTPYKKDLLKPLAKACQEAGIKLCFYHSIMDWHHPDYLPRRPWDPRPDVKADFERYVKYMKAELKELLTDYGPIGILWFDGEWESTWTHERGKDLYSYIRKLQPNIIVNNRVDTARGGMNGFNTTDDAAGDYGTPEQTIPANGFPGVDWESCMTMNDTWGFSSHDHNWKSAETLVRNLIDCASKGGNYLLNVGPTALGEIPQPSVERLAAVGKWLKRYGEAIYKTQAGPFPKALSWGKVTRRGNVLYCHVFDPSATEIELSGFKGKIQKVEEIGYTGGGSLMLQPSDSGVTIPIGHGPDRDSLLDKMPRVIAVTVEGPFTIESPVVKQNPDRSLELKAIDAKVNGSNVAYESAKDCIGYWTTQSDTVEWDFNAVRGEVNVEIELACPEDSAGADYEVLVSGQTLRGKVPSTGAWDKFIKLNLGKVSIVTPGRTKLVVRPLSKPGLGVMNLRAIRFRSAAR
jgi:alpha-L-fucosidase